MIRKLWWEVRYAVATAMRKAGLISWRTNIRFQPYICAVRQMCREQERKQRKWLTCNWCDTPRRVNPKDLKWNEGRCQICNAEWADHYRDKQNARKWKRPAGIERDPLPGEMRMSHTHRDMGPAPRE